MGPAGQIGSARTIVATRLGAACLMAGTALAPTFAVAVVLQILRTAATMMVAPVRQSFTMGLFPAAERASAAGMTGVVRRLSGAASPPVSGALFDAGYLEVPFFVGAGLQVVSAAMYRLFFGALDDRLVPAVATTSDPGVDPAEVGMPLDEEAP